MTIEYLLTSRLSSLSLSKLDEDSLVLHICHDTPSNQFFNYTNWLSRRNDEKVSHTSLLRELQANDPNDFRNYLRMDEDTFKNKYV
nr:unnamed protein product [Callosobruchus chinensis]